MNRFFQWFNLCGVALLVVLCVLQWRMNRRLNLEAVALAKTRLEQQGQLEEQQKTMAGVTRDLETFRSQVTTLHAASRENADRVKAAEQEVAQLTATRDQLQLSITNWAQAVAIRDARLKEADGQLAKLAEERNAAVTRFNDLATKYNTVVNDLNTRTKEFNALVEKYNAAVKASKREASP
ncbi:MAG: hypothetical protein U1G07_07195 [Verrucomicrobiota bacterium]